MERDLSKTRDGSKFQNRCLNPTIQVLKKTQRGKCHLREGKGGYPSNNPQGHEAAHQIRPRAAKQLPLLPLRAPGWRKVVAFLRKMSPSEGLRTRLLQQLPCTPPFSGPSARPPCRPRTDLLCESPEGTAKVFCPQLPDLTPQLSHLSHHTWEAIQLASSAEPGCPEEPEGEKGT